MPNQQDSVTKIESFIVDRYTIDSCRYCDVLVRDGDSLYRADDGDICFECADKLYGPFCRCGNPCGATDIRCGECEQRVRAA